MKKRLIAMLTLLVLVVGIASTSLAATTPTATLLTKSKGQTVSRGDTVYFTFKLDSGSYTKKGDAFRSKIEVLVKYDSQMIGRSTWAWTGKQNYTARASIAKNGSTGKYTLAYKVYYRKNATSNWKKSKSGATRFTVK